MTIGFSGVHAPLLPAVIVVDPCSSGQTLAEHAKATGAQVVAVRQPHAMSSHFRDIGYYAVVEWTNAKEVVAALRALPLRYMATLAGSEEGVEPNDEIGTIMGLRCNDPSTSFARRDKYAMGEKLRSAGVRAVKQCEASCWSADVETFVKSLAEDLEARGLPFKSVVKPTRSAGSDGITFCASVEETREAVETLVEEKNIFGQRNGTVCVQEFLVGREFVVDAVSRDGENRIAGLWSYDKRCASDPNAANVYFGCKTYRPSSNEEARLMVEYVYECLAALGIRNGPSHSELIMRPTRENPNVLEPVLVETGARPHGGSGFFVPILDRVQGEGYNQIDLHLSAYGVTAEGVDRLRAQLVDEFERMQGALAAGVMGTSSFSTSAGGGSGGAAGEVGASGALASEEKGNSSSSSNSSNSNRTTTNNSEEKQGLLTSLGSRRRSRAASSVAAAAAAAAAIEEIETTTATTLGSLARRASRSDSVLARAAAHEVEAPPSALERKASRGMMKASPFHNFYSFDKVPSVILPKAKATGDMCELVSWQARKAVRWADKALMEIASLPSFVSLHKNVNDGEEQVVTKDLLSSPGYAILIHHDGAQVAADSKRIHELCKEGLFEDF